MAYIFQYQGFVEPLLPIAAAPAPELSWLPHYPDTVPHRRSQVESTMYLVPQPPTDIETRVSQLPVETAFAYAFPLTRVSQLPVEVGFAYAVGIRQVRVSQIPIEIAYPFQCPEFRPPLPNACPVPEPPPTDEAPCADDVPPFFPVE